MYSFKVLQESLIDALKVVKDGYGSKPNWEEVNEKWYNEQTSNQVMLIADGSHVRLITPRGAEVLMQADVFADGRLVLPFWSIYEYVLNLIPDTVAIEEQNGKAHMTCGRAEANWITRNADVFPVQDAERGNAILQVPCAWLAVALKKVLPFAPSAKTSRFRKVYFAPDILGNLSLQAADGSNLCVIGSDWNYSELNAGMIVNRDDAAALQKVAAENDGSVTFYRSALAVTAVFPLGTVRFQMEEWPYDFQKKEHIFPDWLSKLETLADGEPIHGQTPPHWNLADAAAAVAGFTRATITQSNVKAASYDGSSTSDPTPIVWNQEFEFEVAVKAFGKVATAVLMKDTKADIAAWENLSLAYDKAGDSVTTIGINPVTDAMIVRRGAVTVLMMGAGK